MPRLFSYRRFAILSLKNVLILFLAVVIGTSLETDQPAEVDWADSSVVLVDGEENSEADSVHIDFVVTNNQSTVVVATSTESLCDFRDIIPKYVLYSSLRLDC